MIYKTKTFFKHHWTSIALVLFLISVFTLSVVGETFPLKEGAECDGQFYYKVAQDFSIDFFHSGYDRFRIFRIFPFFVINLTFYLFSIEPSHENLTHAVYAIHYLNLALQLFFFFKLAKFCLWKKATTIILFASLFFNHFYLKNCGFEPFQTDAFALTIFLASYNLYLRERNVLSILVSFLGLVTWPTVTYIMMILHIFREPFPQDAPRLKYRVGDLLLIFPICSAMVVALLYILHKQSLLESMLFTEASIPLILTNIALWTAFLYWLRQGIKQHFYMPTEYLRRIPWKKFLFIFIGYGAVMAFLGAYANHEYYFNETAFILQILLRPLKYPLITPIAHICYFGILPLLVLFFFRDFVKEIFGRSPGYALAFFVIFFFATDSEARHIFPQIPLFLIPLGHVLNQKALSIRQATAFVLLQVALSRFYLPINVGDFTENLLSQNYTTAAAQRYFINLGPWFTWSTYAICTAIVLVSAFLCSRILKKSKR